MLKTAGFSLPTKVHIHGFLTVDGEKMSKSKGTFVRARTYLKHLDPATCATSTPSKLSSRVDDLDLNLDEFVAKVNADLVGKVVNLASRTAKFVETTGLSTKYPDDGGLFAARRRGGRRDRRGLRSLRLQPGDAADHGAGRSGQSVRRRAASRGSCAKDPAAAGELQDVCTVALNLFRQIGDLSGAGAAAAGRADRRAARTIRSQAGTNRRQPLVGTPVAKFKHMLQRVERKGRRSHDRRQQSRSRRAGDVSGRRRCQHAGTTTATALAAEPLAAECTIDDFAKVDLRVARVIAAEEVPEAKKLLKLTLSLGGDDEARSSPASRRRTSRTTSSAGW